MTAPIFTVQVSGSYLGRKIYRGRDLVAGVAVASHGHPTDPATYCTRVYYTAHSNMFDSVRYGPAFPTIMLAVGHIMQNETELAGLLDELAAARTVAGGWRKKRTDARRIFDPTVPAEPGAVK